MLTPGSEPRRPTAIMLVYSWDLLLALGGFFGVFAAFAGGAAIGSGEFDVPLALQIVAALSAAAYSAAAVTVATMLTRRSRWVRRSQMTVLGVAIGLALASLVIGALRGGVPGSSLLGSLLYVLVDGVAMVAMTGRNVSGWYSRPGPAPAYVSGTIALWAAGGVTVALLLAIR